VRRLARRLHEEYGLPVYVLVDNDPWGYYIYSVVKQGSINLAFESERMAIPKAKFIGLSSSDPDTYGLPRNVASAQRQRREPGQRADQLPLVPEEGLAGRDQADARERPQVRARCAANKDFRYLSKTYLPKKLKERDWLD